MSYLYQHLQFIYFLFMTYSGEQWAQNRESGNLTSRFCAQRGQVTREFVKY